ncbi:tetratricopeptide repeat protein [Thalassotalea euphylliae]|uniref:tetratricopeptide repeat protein n=1 Tax=Thalassotalea euphylliae TaxID=1655234 RepID=UPI003633D85C
MSWTRIIIVFGWLFCCSSALAQHSRETILSNTDQVNSFYDAGQESLPHDKILQLATDIVRNRSQYTKEVIARAYVLLAEVANNRGDASRAFQFAVDGLTYKPLPAELQLNLETKLVSGYFVKSKYHNVFYFVEQVHALAKEHNLVKYQLLALGYRAMANAIVGNDKKATDDLLALKAMVDDNKEYAEHIELLEIIASSYHYLGDFSTALRIHERVLKLRFALNKMNGLDNTYYNLASAYHKVDRLDDAYNAFWEAKKIAEANDWPLKRAYAELGLGQVLLDQKDYQNAYLALIEAENSFKGQNLNKPYMSTLIALSKASAATNRLDYADTLLIAAEELAEVADVSSEQIELFVLLARRYQRLGDTQKAYKYLNRYVKNQQQFFPLFQNNETDSVFVEAPTASNKALALELAESYEVHTEFSDKLEEQKQLTSMLVLFGLLLLVVNFLQWLSYRSRKQNYVYEQLERPSYILPSPAQTKYIYHRAFKKARKYEYPLVIGYLAITNWQDLTFSFNKRVINEVNKTIATMINEHLGEFDQTGQINDGEYIVLYPHHQTQEAKEKFEKMIEAIKVRFFANLGEFSVNLQYSIDAPVAQDIDPYIFLSRLSER